MKKKKLLSVALASAFLLPSLASLGGCGSSDTIVLRVYNWEEYIDEGGKGTFIYDELHELNDEGDPVTDKNGHVHIESDIVNDDYKAWYQETTGQKLSEEGPRLLDDFCLWYERTYGQKIRVEYSTFGTNEDMYNEIILGNEYDLLCPSDYMIMKLAAEGWLEKYDDGCDENGVPDGSYNFFDPEVPENYYVRNVSPFIADKFENNAGLAIRKDDNGEEIYWKDYAAGYMWGTTGFVYNPVAMNGTLEAFLEECDWGIFTNEKVAGRITAKDNVRDTYFAALGVTYQEEAHNQAQSLAALKAQFDAGTLSPADYTEGITRIFNATDDETISIVEPCLMDIKKNIFSFETDTGKADMVAGKIWLNYAWSGDAVYAIDLAESGVDEDGKASATARLNYYVPKTGTNLFFDGWVMPKGANKQAAQAFVNFLSMPQNAMRNSYYIGYTSVIAGENQEMRDYADYLYGYEFDPEEEEEPAETVEYDLTYFFRGENYTGDKRVEITAEKENATKRQLYAQFPPEEVIARCAVMDYYDREASERINELWSRVKAETLDAWAIVVISVTVLAIAAFIVFVKFGGEIDFFRARPKKGFRLVKQEDYKQIK